MAPPPPPCLYPPMCSLHRDEREEGEGEREGERVGARTQVEDCKRLASREQHTKLKTKETGGGTFKQILENYVLVIRGKVWSNTTYVRRANKSDWHLNC